MGCWKDLRDSCCSDSAHRPFFPLFCRAVGGRLENKERLAWRIEAREARKWAHRFQKLLGRRGAWGGVQEVKQLRNVVMRGPGCCTSRAVSGEYARRGCKLQRARMAMLQRAVSGNRAADDALGAGVGVRGAVCCDARRSDG